MLYAFIWQTYVCVQHEIHFSLYTSWGVIWDRLLCSRTKGWPTRFFHLAFTADTKYFSYMFQVHVFFSLWTFIYLCIYWLSHHCVDKWGVSEVGWFSHQSEASAFDDLVINFRICSVSVSSVYRCLISWYFYFLLRGRPLLIILLCCIGLHDILFQQWHHNRHMYNSNITRRALSSSLWCFILSFSVFQWGGNGTLFGMHSGARVSDLGLKSRANLWLVNGFNLKHHGSAHK